MYTCKPGITLLSLNNVYSSPMMADQGLSYMHTYTVYVSTDARLRAAAHTCACNQQPTLGMLMIHAWRHQIIHAWIIAVFLVSFSPAEE